MKDLVKIYARPKLNSPVMLAAWPGIGDVAMIVASYLKKELDFKRLGEIEASYFFDPIGVSVRENVVEAPQFPQNNFYYWKNKDGRNDLLTIAFLMEQDYIVIHETKGKCRSTGSSKTTSGNPVGERFGHSRSSPAGRIIAILCETLEGGDRDRRKRSVDGEASPRPAFPLVSRTERGTSGITSRRASGSWVCKSIVDTATDSQGNRGSFRCKVSSGPCLEDSPRLWLELSKAAAVGQGKG